MADFATLIFLLSQLGMSLGLGAATFSLMFYFVSATDGRVDQSEARFISATKTTLVCSLFLIVVTGLLVTAAHVLAGERDVVMAPIFLGKWALIAILILGGFAHRLKLIPSPVAGVISGASWYALFIVHTLAPALPWSVLGIGYALWVLVFAVGFYLIGKVATDGVQSAAAPRPTLRTQASVAPPAPPAPRPVTLPQKPPGVPTPAIRPNPPVVPQKPPIAQAPVSRPVPVSVAAKPAVAIVRPPQPSVPQLNSHPETKLAATPPVGQAVPSGQTPPIDFDLTKGSTSH